MNRKEEIEKWMDECKNRQKNEKTETREIEQMEDIRKKQKLNALICLLSRKYLVKGVLYSTYLYVYYVLLSTYRHKFPLSQILTKLNLIYFENC